MSTDKTINYTREAFLHPVNLVFLLVASIAASLASGVGPASQLIMLSAIGAELIYLGIVPKTERFQNSIKMRRMREESTMKPDRRVYQNLDEASQKRFLVLKHISNQIKQNFSGLPRSSQVLLDNITTKMEGLLSNYLINLDLLARYENYLGAASDQTLKVEIKALEKELDNVTSEKVREIKERRLSILNKRLEKLKKAREKFQICESQLETIEDAIRYIYEKSMTMNNPEEIGFQLDNLINDLEETATMMEDIEDDLPPTYTVLQQLEELQTKETKRSQATKTAN